MARLYNCNFITFFICIYFWDQTSYSGIIFYFFFNKIEFLSKFDNLLPYITYGVYLFPFTISFRNISGFILFCILLMWILVNLGDHHLMHQLGDVVCVIKYE